MRKTEAVFMDHKFIADRAANFTPSVLMQLQGMMSGMDDIIDLSIGDPDFTTPEPILTAGYQDALKGYTHYSPAKGYPDVIQAVIDSYKKKLNIDLGADRVEILKRTMAPHGVKATRPIDYFETPLPTAWGAKSWASMCRPGVQKNSAPGAAFLESTHSSLISTSMIVLKNSAFVCSSRCS